MGYYRRMYRTRRRTRYGHAQDRPAGLKSVAVPLLLLAIPATCGLSLLPLTALLIRQIVRGIDKRTAPAPAAPQIEAAPAPTPAEPPVIRRWERVWGLDGSYEDVLVPVKR